MNKRDWIGNPLADAHWTTPYFHAFVFDLNQELHSVRADHLYLGEFDSDDSVTCLGRLHPS
jgi:hypothetical protein